MKVYNKKLAGSIQWFVICSIEVLRRDQPRQFPCSLLITETIDLQRQAPQEVKSTFQRWQGSFATISPSNVRLYTAPAEAGLDGDGDVEAWCAAASAYHVGLFIATENEQCSF